jgi:hypothetical protein
LELDLDGGLGELFHRKRQDVPAKTLAKIHAVINIKRIHLTRLLRAADLPECRIPKIETDDLDSSFTVKRIADIARRTRALWMLPPGPIENLCGAIEDAGGVVIPCDFETLRVDAVSQWVPSLPPLFFVNNVIPQDRLRYSLAHELGHLILHQMTHENADPSLTPHAEQQANAFAAELLLPEREIRPDLFDLTLPRLAVLKLLERLTQNSRPRFRPQQKCPGTEGNTARGWQITCG